MVVIPRMRSPAAGRGDLWILAALALAKLVFHLATSQGWGYFRDELYYIACSDRLAWGYVDHPPLSILLLRMVRETFGESLPALRLLSAVAGAASVFVTGLIARELGGGRAAQVLAALCTFFAPVFLVMGHYYSMNGIDVLCWAALALLAIRILQRDQPRLWVWFGLLAGLGLENKYSVAFFAAGLAGGLLLTPQRRQLASPWLWLGGGLAALLFAPHLWWQIDNGYPSLEFMAAATAKKNVRLGPVEFFLGQITLGHPLALPLWLAGVAGLLVRPAWSAVRPLGFAYVILFAVFVLQGGKVYYLTPILPLLFGAGAALLDAGAAARAWRWPVPAYAGLMLVLGLAAVPVTVPVLPVETQLAYIDAIGISEPRMERNARGALPQHLADFFGWNELVDTVARVADRLPPAERARAVVVGRNYGDAGAVEVLGRPRGLPRAISGHNSYWLWGPGRCTGEVMVVLGDRRERLEELFADVRLGAVSRCRDCMPYEDGRSVWVARGLKQPLDRLWPRVKGFI
jgi:hypothetical protein